LGRETLGCSVAIPLAWQVGAGRSLRTSVARVTDNKAPLGLRLTARSKRGGPKGIEPDAMFRSAARRARPNRISADRRSGLLRRVKARSKLDVRRGTEPDAMCRSAARRARPNRISADQQLALRRIVET